jgi:hypothetical protein
MLRRLHRRRGRLKRIEAEADTPIQHLGVEAYAEARRQEREANDLATGWYWNAVALAVVRKTSKRVGFDLAARTAADDFVRVLEAVRSSPHPPLPEPGQTSEATSVVSEGPQGVQFRVRYLGAAGDGAASILQEVVGPLEQGAVSRPERPEGRLQGKARPFLCDVVRCRNRHDRHDPKSPVQVCAEAQEIQGKRELPSAPSMPVRECLNDPLSPTDLGCAGIAG